MKRVIIHVGLPKTGTTSIQKYCAMNRPRLIDLGLRYPKLGIEPPANYRPGGMNAGIWNDENHSLLRAAIDKDLPKQYQVFSEFIAGDPWSRVLLAFDRSDQGTLLLSHEGFFRSARTLEYTRVKELLKGFDVHIIVYVRRFDDWIESYYKHTIRGGMRNRRALADMPLVNDAGKLAFSIHCNVLKDGFGASRVIVRSFDKARKDGTLVSGFFENCGLPFPGQGKALSLNERNSSLSSATTLFLLAGNKMGLSEGTHAQIRRHSVDQAISYDFPRFRLMSETLRENLKKQYLTKMRRATELFDCAGLHDIDLSDRGHAEFREELTVAELKTLILRTMPLVTPKAANELRRMSDNL